MYDFTSVAVVEAFTLRVTLPVSYVVDVFCSLVG